MFTLTHDPEAGTLYFYFTELTAGQVNETLEYPAYLLLDASGQIVGVRLDLDDELTLAQLELALDGDFSRLDLGSGHLRLPLVDQPVAREVPLAATALIDLDADETVLGVELVVPAELRSPTALALLTPLLVPLDDAPTAGEGPIVFAPPPEPVDEEAADEADDLDEADAADEPDAADEADDLDEADAADEPDTTDEPDSTDEPNARQEVASAPVPDAARPRPSLQPASPAVGHRSGFVALVGKPNVGKSTLLNALLGQKLAIVSPLPQTTRVPARGILSRPDAQIIFVDTPGIHQPNHALGRLMVDLAEQVLPNADVIGFMVDLSQPPSRLDRQIAQQVQRARGRKLLILNKVDLRPSGPGNHLEAYRALGTWELELAISAERRLGLPALLEAMVERLPAGPPLYPIEQITDQSEQHLAAEFVREKVLYHTQQEVPHAVAVEVEEWEQRDQTLFIRMTINVERDGQKAIIIGAGGSMLKKIGSAARFEIERMLGQPVYLELWVKVRPGWRDDSAALGWLGYRAKDWR
ncbi:MAG: GTPase Era [Oscillochloridaceae bacterium umkhey_bin13]